MAERAHLNEHITIKWLDGEREPKHPPNPTYPNGIDLDISQGKTPYCQVELPYPAKRCGIYVISCRACDQRNLVTTAGRPDDPRSLKMACKK